MKTCLHCRKDIPEMVQEKGKNPRKQRDDTQFCSQTCWTRHHRNTDIGWARKLFAGSRDRSKKKKIPLDIDVDFILTLLKRQNRKCAVTGVPLDFSTTNFKINPYRGSLDRVDSLKGYTKDNVRLVCVQVNYMKNILTDTELKFWCEKILKGGK